jgi:hypothetical protein
MHYGVCTLRDMQDRTEPLPYKLGTIKPATPVRRSCAVPVSTRKIPRAVRDGFTRAAVQDQWSLVVLE